MSINNEGLKTKQFWKSIKSKRSLKSSVKCLIKNNQVFTKLKDILNVLNDTFFEAVNQDSGDNGNLSTIPHMPNIEVTFHGVKKA